MYILHHQASRRWSFRHGPPSSHRATSLRGPICDEEGVSCWQQSTLATSLLSHLAPGVALSARVAVAVNAEVATARNPKPRGILAMRVLLLLRRWRGCLLGPASDRSMHAA
jgi:hypothetical protein